MITSWSRRKEDIATKVGWRIITRKHFVTADGIEHDFDTIGAVGAQVAAVVALTEDNRIIIAEQFRTGPECIMQDLPGGMVDSGEAPIDAARREMIEETGYEVGSIEFLGMASDDGYSNVERHFFLARDCKQIGDQQLEHAEEIELKLLTIQEVLNNARTNRMTDALAVYYASDELKKLL